MKQHRLFITLLMALTVHATQADDIKVVGQNLQNFFYSLDRGRTQGNGSITLSNYNTETGRTAKLNAIVGTLSQYEADIYAFNEVECCEEVLQLLAQSMSEKTGKNYMPVTDGLSYDLTSEPDGVIKSGFIYNAATIEPVGENLSTAVGYNHFYPATMRMQGFKSKSDDEVFYISMNHFKASTSSDITDDINQRESNSISLLKGLDQAVLDPDILIMGDLNSEMGEQCLNNLVDAGFTEQILKHEGSSAASHWYYATGSLIDHVFANSTMSAQITDAHMLYVANPHSTGNYNTAYSDHDPYMVTLNLQAQPVAKFGYRKVEAVSAGKSYLMVFNNEKISNTVSTSKTYEYLSVTNVSPSDNVITLTSDKNGFKFEDDGNGYYYIKDAYGRYIYLYLNGSSYNYTTNAGNKANAQSHSVVKQSNGTFHVHNNVANYNILYATNHNDCSWRNWTSLNNGQYWPTLWEYDPSITVTGITEIPAYTQPSTTRKVMEQGHLIIITPSGSRYNLQGIQIR